ncbi:MAG: hypothetical protein COA49_02290 [Bacteroidetes bacterium]|nr:MAG: hypothetical protein COA49_02290 [Bacteroidota bacterium]
MGKFSSKLLLGVMKGVGMQPWWLIHMESSFLSWFMSLVGGYRGKIVRGNLDKVFGKEGVKYEGGFYKNFCDITLESMKLFSASEESILERMEYGEEGLELIDELHKKGRNVILVAAHMSNWEMYAMTFSRKIAYKTVALYKKLSDPVIDEAMKTSRQRMGLEMTEIAECKKWMDTHVAKGGEPIAVGFGFDQSPQSPKRAWWTTFLGVETAVYFGVEQWAHRYDAAIVYSSVRRVGRGRYKVNFRLVVEDVKELTKGEVVDKCLGELEKEIIASPSDWLWSHKRWKHSRPEGMVLQPRAFERKLVK